MVLDQEPLTSLKPPGVTNQGRIARIVIVSGTMETSLHPVPPVADSAPEWNVFRLAEAESSLDIHVISPCEEGQRSKLNRFKANGNYHHVVFSDLALQIYRKYIRHFLPFRLAGRRLMKLPDLMSWWYLRQVTPLLAQLKPDLVIINARPQYIRYLRRIVPYGRLLLFMRGEMGESRRFLSQLDGIIVNSKGMADYAKQFVNVSETPLWKMPNSLGDEFLVPDEPSDRFERSEKDIIFAGRVIPVKGVLELVKAFKLVLEDVPEAALVICGAADNFKMNGYLSDYERAVRREAADLSAGKIRYEGYIPNDQMGAYYTQAFLAVFPSIYNESFGMVALEAMRCSTPVVASRRPGFEELIAPGETGYLVDDPTNCRALADAMVRVLSDLVLANQMGEAGYEKSLQYTPDQAAKRFEEIVNDIAINLLNSDDTKNNHK